MMGLSGPGGIDLYIGGGDHAEMHNLSSGVRSYIKSYNNGEGDVAYIEDLGWKLIYDGMQGWTTFTRSGGNIPLQATELLVQFYANIPNSYSSRGTNSTPSSYWYTESNWFSVPLKYGGGGWNIYHFGSSGFHVTADGVTHRGETGGIVAAQGNVERPTYKKYDGNDHYVTVFYSLDYSRAFIRRVMWR